MVYDRARSRLIAAERESMGLECGPARTIFSPPDSLWIMFQSLCTFNIGLDLPPLPLLLCSSNQNVPYSYTLFSFRKSVLHSQVP